MTTQYNVVTYGSLTNTSGVLSNFSVSNYATLPLNFNPTLLHYDIVFKFKTTDASEEQALFTVYNANDYTYPVISIEIYNSALYFETTDGESQLSEIDGTTTLSSNTDYWFKLNRNGNIYTLSLSTDGNIFTSEGTDTTSTHPPLNDYVSLIGLYYNSVDTFKLPFIGGIDLNGSYIDVDSITVWQGATTVSNVETKIQLRHDTAANWTSVNPILLEGEVGIETDTRKQKFGDGITAWNSLPYDVGSTALQSITSSDVTTALGYTPVNKAGDTMSGSLTTSGLLVTSNAMRIIHSGITRDGSTPAESSWKAINFVDNSSTPLRFGLIESSVLTNGGVNLNLYAYKNQITNETAKIELGWTGSGTQYCTFPNTTCADGQWVNSVSTLSTTTTVGSYSIDLSSYLPNDGATYLVKFRIEAEKNATKITYYALTTAFSKMSIGVTNQYASNLVNIVDLPVSTRSITYGVENNAPAQATLKALGYRRIGTNS